MTDDTVRIAMWSGPRNISTAMMRAFENRPDAAVVDEPFYAAYLAATGLDHPLREAVLASQPQDWRMVTTALSGPSPDGAPLFYQKHMTHHMLPEIKTDFMALCRNAFLIRSPAAVIASYAARRETVALEDIGVVRQAELFDEEADRLGHAPPVLDGAEVLENPEGLLRALCAALGIDFLPVMLSWPPGRRASDGVWAPAWYDQVERSTGFVRPTLVAGAPPALSAPLSRLAEAAQPFYDRLAPWRLRPLDGSGNGAAA